MSVLIAGLSATMKVAKMLTIVFCLLMMITSVKTTLLGETCVSRCRVDNAFDVGLQKGKDPVLVFNSASYIGLSQNKLEIWGKAQRK